MVLTLILVTAIAEFYAIIGDSVKDGRAMIELGGRLRAAVERLTADLDLITVSVVPWTDDGSSSGYFEYFEGRGNDYDADADGIVDATLDVNGNNINDLIENGLTNLLGDADDFLAFTIRANGQPFSGRYFAPSSLPAGSRPIITSTTSSLAASATTPAIVNSQLAEVVWWVGFDDRDGNLLWTVNSGFAANTTGIGEPRHLYRRQLLIRPELGQLGTDYTPISNANWQIAQRDLMRFWQFNDVSASIRVELATSGWVYRIRANSLNDLTRRENRFGHMPLQVDPAKLPPSGALTDSLFPHSAVTQSTASAIKNLLPCYSAATLSVANLAGTATAGTTSYALQRMNDNSNLPLGGTGPGEDIVLSNILGFDVKAYDPYARVWPSDTTNTMSLLPHDPGYSAAAASGTPQKLIGLGAFVDLNYYQYLTTAAITTDNNLNTSMGILSPYFGPAPGVPPGVTASTYSANFGYTNGGAYASTRGATYDTWALSYERDGIDQSGNGTYDLQTNGIDDAIGGSANGVVDDVNERDTLPPYSQPLRGLQVKIRVYEPSTRQVRQASVAADFITE